MYFVYHERHLINTGVSLTPSLFLKFFRAELCLWWSMLDDVTIIGIRCAVVSPVEWLRSWNIAILRELHSSMLLLPFRLTVKHGTSVSGPISFKYSRASWSCSLKKRICHLLTLLMICHLFLWKFLRYLSEFFVTFTNDSFSDKLLLLLLRHSLPCRWQWFSGFNDKLIILFRESYP